MLKDVYKVQQSADVDCKYERASVRVFKGFVVKVSPIYKAKKRNITVLAKLKDFRGNYINVEAIHNAADALLKGNKGEIATLNGYWFVDSGNTNNTKKYSFIAYNGRCERWKKHIA